MRWTVHGERALYDSDWVRLTLVDVEIPGEARFEHHVVRSTRAAAGAVVHDPDRGVLLHAQTDHLDWFAGELARLPFDFSIEQPDVLRDALAARARRLLHCAAEASAPG